VVTLDELLDRGDARRRANDAGRQVLTAVGAVFYRIGWAAAKLVLLALYILGAVFYGIGWIASRAIWPALVWSGAAVRVGWEDGRKRAQQR
jgi:hypothetical protein